MSILQPGDTLEGFKQVVASNPDRAASITASFLFHAGLLQQRWPDFRDVPADLAEFISNVRHSSDQLEEAGL